MSKTLSVSIAAYNVGKFLDNTLSSLCVESVLDDIEVIIVNDGSKDDTSLIAKKYVDEYPNTFILVNKENGGYGSTINSSLKIASGKYFKLLDGDDWFDSNNLLDFVKSLKNADADLVYTPFYFVSDEDQSKKIELFSFSQNKVVCSSEIYALSMHAMTIKTSIIRGKVSITEHCFYTDFEFALKCIDLSSNLLYINIPIYCYRIGLEGQSVSIAGYLKHVDDHEKMTKLALSYVFGDAKFMKIRHQIEDMVQRHMNILVLNNDEQRYLAFINYLKTNYSMVKSTKGLYQRIVYMFPHVLYRPFSYIKRKRTNLK